MPCALASLFAVIEVNRYTCSTKRLVNLPLIHSNSSTRILPSSRQTDFLFGTCKYTLLPLIGKSSTITLPLLCTAVLWTLPHPEHILALSSSRSNKNSPLLSVLLIICVTLKPGICNNSVIVSNCIEFLLV